MDWNHLARDRGQWQDLMKTNILGSIIFREFNNSHMLSISQKGFCSMALIFCSIYCPCFAKKIIHKIWGSHISSYGVLSSGIHCCGEYKINYWIWLLIIKRSNSSLLQEFANSKIRVQSASTLNTLYNYMKVAKMFGWIIQPASDSMSSPASISYTSTQFQYTRPFFYVSIIQHQK